ncbi:clan AA aspartic protease [Leptolyngbya sp. AN03gr2]|uniref:clan AA aspartic protease n=1 Tax=unclassified Leptolyngbya TaxID=2650499 RepID=UPI003D319A27
MAGMGLVYAEIELVRGADVVLAQEGFIEPEQIRRCTVQALVDSGATMLAIPEIVRSQLDLRKSREIEADLADGSSVSLDVVGPVEVRFQNRRTFVEAIVTPNSTTVLLGAIPMEGMDVLIDPKRQRLIVNPESPEIAKMMLM